MRLLFVAITLGLLAGCPPSLDEYVLVDDGGRPLRDVSGRPDGGGGGMTGGPCRQPLLMIAVESIDGDAPSYGRIARFELLDDDEVRRCGDLTGSGMLMQTPMVVTAVRDDLVLVADFDGNYAMIEPVSDTLVGRAWADGRRARDAFPLRDPDNGRFYPAVAWSNTGSGNIRWVTLYDSADTAPYLEVPVASDGLRLGLNIASISRSPVSDSEMLVLRPDAYAAVEANPFTLVANTDDPYIEVGEEILDKIAAVNTSGSYERVIWTGTGATSGDEGVFFVNDGASRFPAGPFECTERECDYHHAVPDPRHPQDWFALCGTGGVERDLVHFNQFTDSRRACQVILPADAFESRTRFSYLSTHGVP